jgi:hypothetical protein
MSFAAAGRKMSIRPVAVELTAGFIIDTTRSRRRREVPAAQEELGKGLSLLLNLALPSKQTQIRSVIQANEGKITL